MNAVEAELTTRLASTARLREAARPRLASLLRRVDTQAYAMQLDERGLLALLGSRTLELVPEAADDAFRSRVEEAMRHARARALVLDATLRRVARALEERGIPVLPLKGTTLADRVHGDPGLRPTTDVDVLVPRAQVGAAVETLRGLGYPPPEDPVWVDGLPEMHYTFMRADGVLPRVELHWRIHWSEGSFSDELFRASTVAPDGLRRADPAHEFALLVLVFARDGLYGPRLVADTAAWWDRLGDQLPPGALDPIVARHPPLRRSLVAGIACLEQFIGTSVRGVLSDPRVDRSARLAVALADPLFADEHADVFATIMSIDALLSTGWEKLGFLQRYVVQPLPYVRSTYGFQEAHTAVVVGRSAAHAVGTVKKVPRLVRAAARARRRTELPCVGRAPV
jgi:hypothetical protein